LDGEFYIGSADWMYRNLHARVEAIVPILDRQLKEKLWEILQLCLKDNRQAWTMNSAGEYTQKISNEAGIHQILMDLTKARNIMLDKPGSGDRGSYADYRRTPRRRRGQNGIRKGGQGGSPQASDHQRSKAHAKGGSEDT
jgi:hypothetical protein